MKIVTKPPSVIVPMFKDLSVGDMFRQNAIPMAGVYLKLSEGGSAFNVNSNTHASFDAFDRVRFVEGYVVTIEDPVR
jgi:hypothetical protein